MIFSKKVAFCGKVPLSLKQTEPMMMTEKEAMDQVSKLAKRLKPEEVSSSKEPLRQTITSEAVFKMFQK